MTIFTLQNHRPSVAKTAYVAPNATVIGQVRLAENASVWPGAVVRGDNDLIAIESGTNVQDAAVLHVDSGHPISIGRDVTVGHAAVVHGCTIGDGSLVGIHATILNDAKIGKESIVAAGSVVPEGKSYPDRSLIMGVPGKVVRQITDDEVKWIADNARDYAARAVLYREHLK
ncbi:MAG: gamma carbonic anhydrase family protein [Afipia sp.]|jgi:carbonic anhydrase/acetyltransferase-like protein (isoleucine patch superfamily)|nr:gamma carbonic anhydrase family protein [Afipia sp.]